MCIILWDCEPAFSCLFFPAFIQFSFFSILLIMKFLVKDFCKIVQASVVIFGMQVENDVLYCGIVNQPFLFFFFPVFVRFSFFPYFE